MNQHGVVAPPERSAREGVQNSNLFKWEDEGGHKNDLSELAESFRQMDLQRQRRWYGGKGDGETSRKVLSTLDRIKGRVRT